MGAWDPQTLCDPDIPHFLLPKSCTSSCSRRVRLNMQSYQCSALKLSGSRQETDIHHFMASYEPYTFQHMWLFDSVYSCAYSNGYIVLSILIHNSPSRLLHTNS